MTAIAGYDYLLSGESWADPSHITYSIAPDGVFWDHGTNNLNATFNAKFGTDGTWQKQIARARQPGSRWPTSTSSPVGDSTYDFNVLGSSQGDPRFGDIRFGGYAFPGNTTTLAQTYFPPPNGSTAAGDVEVNTSMGFNIGSDLRRLQRPLARDGSFPRARSPQEPERGDGRELRGRASPG